MNLEIKQQIDQNGSVLLKKLGETTGEMDDSDESTTEAEDYYTENFCWKMCMSDAVQSIT